MNEKDDKKSYLTPHEVAEWLMVSPATVRQWVEKGSLRALTTPGGHRRFLACDVNSFARSLCLTLNNTTDCLRLMIIDEDDWLVNYLKDFLHKSSEKIVVETANDNFTAGLKIQAFKPDIALIGLSVETFNGVELCRQLKSEIATANIRIFVMTWQSLEEIHDEMKGVEVEVCLTKPVDEKLLCDCLGLI